jgi:hypothetical protein
MEVPGRPSYQKFFLRQFGRLSRRPAAFRPLLTDGLVLSGKSDFLRNIGDVIKGLDYVNQKNQIVKTILFSVNWS